MFITMGKVGTFVALIFLAIIITIVVLAIFYGQIIYDWIKNFNPIDEVKDLLSGKTPLGGSCKLHTDCEGWGPATDAAACCKGICTKKVKDWAGVGYCPNECRDAPAPLGKLGSCDSGNHWPREEGEDCDTHAACKGWVAGKVGTLACCKGKCTPLVKDWAGVGYCPNECRDAPAPLGKLGSCDSGNHWPRSEGQDCDTHAACKGWVAGTPGKLACCKGKCTPLVKDWAGVGYCPDECVGVAGGKPGSCNEDGTVGVDLGGSCKLHTDCKGWGPGATDVACCNGVCTKKLKDWAGVGYCPNECRDAPAPLGKLGSCSSGNTWPRSEGQDCDTHAACKGWVAGKVDTLACCKGKCTPLLKDWAGVGYCPSECKISPVAKPGTCKGKQITKKVHSI